MMKIIFFVLSMYLIYFMEKKMFWFSSSSLFLLIIGLIMMNLGFDMIKYLTSTLVLDMYSYSLMTLSVWISMLMIFSSNSVYKGSFNIKLFFFSIMILLVVLLITFSVSNLLTFYFFFEFSLIPTLIIILGWGYQPERLQSGVYFLFYTLTASLPLLLGLSWWYLNMGGLDFFVEVMNVKNKYLSLMVFLIFSLAFLVKMPMFFTHLWLPKAHVEAPVAGSMILAGVLLKLGGYGLFRVFFMFLENLLKYGGYFFGLSISGMLFVGFMCCRLNDLKALVAYSSVAHMGLVICGLLSYYYWGVEGALIMMLAHGLASSGLFCSVSMYYERSGSRSFFFNSGLIGVFPLFSLLFFMLCIANMAAPPTLNLVSEIFLMGSMMKFNYLMILLFPLGSYLGAVFTLFLFSYSQHGRSYLKSTALIFGSFREYHLYMLHIMPVNWLILNLDFYMNVN